MISTVWMAFCAIGAAVLHLALVITASPVAAVTLAVVGIAELLWAVVALRDRVRMPSLALGIAVVVPLSWALSLVAETRGAPPLGLPLATMLAASALQFIVAALLAVRLRRARVEAQAASAGTRQPGTLALLTSMLVAGVLVGAVTTPALAETAAGQNARPHGEHLIGELAEPAGHDEH